MYFTKTLSEKSFLSPKRLALLFCALFLVRRRSKCFTPFLKIGVFNEKEPCFTPFLKRGLDCQNARVLGMGVFNEKEVRFMLRINIPLAIVLSRGKPSLPTAGRQTISLLTKGANLPQKVHAFFGEPQGLIFGCGRHPERSRGIPRTLWDSSASQSVGCFGRNDKPEAWRVCRESTSPL